MYLIRWENYQAHPIFIDDTCTTNKTQNDFQSLCKYQQVRGSSIAIPSIAEPEKDHQYLLTLPTQALPTQAQETGNKVHRLPVP